MNIVRRITLPAILFLAMSSVVVSAATVATFSGSGIATETSDGLQLSGNYNGTLSGFDPAELSNYRVSFTISIGSTVQSGDTLGLADALEQIANAAMTGADVDFDGRDDSVAAVLLGASGILTEIAPGGFFGASGTFLTAGSTVATDSLLTFARDNTLDGFTVAQEDFTLEATLSSPTVVPLPASLPLLAGAVGALALRRRRRH